MTQPKSTDHCDKHNEIAYSLAENNRMLKDIHDRLIGSVNGIGLLEEVRIINKRLSDGSDRMTDSESKIKAIDEYLQSKKPFIDGAYSASKTAFSGMLVNLWRIVPWLAAFMLGLLFYHREIGK